MVPYPLCENGRGPMFPLGVGEGGSGALPIHPRHEFISYEECTAAERARLINLIQTEEEKATRLCRSRCDARKAFIDQRKKLTDEFLTVNKKYQTNDNYARVEVLKDRKRKKLQNELRQTSRLWIRARRDQTYYSLRLQAVINGIAYRAVHPDHTFVIYIRERDVVLQRTQTVAPIYIPPTTTQRILHRHRELRAEVNLETNHFISMDSVDDPETRERTDDSETETCCNCPPLDDEWKHLNETTFQLVHAGSVFELLGFTDTEPKIILTPKDPKVEKVIGKAEGLADIYENFQELLKGWNRDIQYTEPYSVGMEKMKMLQKLLTDSPKPVQKKIDAINWVRATIQKQMQASLNWYYNKNGATTDINQMLQVAINALI